jgi:hypothetical protein
VGGLPNRPARQPLRACPIDVAAAGTARSSVVTSAHPAAATADQLRTSVCPGCGSVLAVAADVPGRHPGASPSCWGLFQVTVRGLRDEAAQDVQTAALLQLARDTYDAQHLESGQPAAAVLRLSLQLERGQEPLPAAALADRLDDADLGPLEPPARWTTTLADLAAAGCPDSRCWAS